MAQILFNTIITLVIFNFLFERLLDYLNNKNWNSTIPDEMKGFYDEEKYQKSREYDRERTRFSVYTSLFSLVLLLGMLFFAGFSFLDNWARTITQNPIYISLIFFGVLFIASDLLGIPFSIYSIFVIEEKFGFNKTTIKTFILDKLKGYILGAIIGGGLIALLVWFYHSTGNLFWLYSWGAITIFMIFMLLFYASIFVPIFNKLTPLEDGELKKEIQEYCDKVDFKLENIFVLDGSKRSSKANAFFSGLGAKKKIVLYDTLIEKHTQEELIAVLAHEIGHYKHKHTLSSLIIGVLQTGLMLYILSFFLKYPITSFALGVQVHSFHIGILVFSMLYSPVSTLLGIGMNILSRKNEFEADAFAAKTYNGNALQLALKKLSVDSLSNLYPHWLDVFINYSHPPLLARLKALKNSRFV